MPATSLDRIPPQNLEAEQSALGSAMLQPAALIEIRSALEPCDFYRDAHGLVMSAMSALQDRREPVDLITLQDELRSRGHLETIGGVDYLMALVDSVPTAANAEYYAGLVKDASRRRYLIGMAARLEKRAADPADDVAPIISDLISEILNLTTGKETRLQHIASVLSGLWDRIEAAYRDGSGYIGLRTGIPGLDTLIGGMEGGDLMVIGGRPSKGKSALALQIALNVAKEAPVLMCSLEMSANYLTLRHLGATSGIETARLRRGEIHEDEFPTIADAIGREYGRDLWYFEAGAISIGDLQTQARRSAIKMATQGKGPALLIVDHLGFVTAPGDNRVVQIGNALLGIKTLARELSLPAIVCCQLHRPERGAADKKPTLESLRESGHIEEHSDMVLLIHNPEAGAGKLLTEPVPAWLILAKHRNGPTGSVEMMWDARVQRFYEIERRQEEAA